MITELSGTHSVVNTVRAVLFSVHVGLLGILSADWFSRAAGSLEQKATLLLLFLLTKLFFLMPFKSWEHHFTAISSSVSCFGGFFCFFFCSSVVPLTDVEIVNFLSL